MNKIIIIEVDCTKGEFLSAKYIGQGQLCYLEEALLNKLDLKAKVSSYGFTTIDEVEYKPSDKTPFDSTIVKNAFLDRKILSITLERITT